MSDFKKYKKVAHIYTLSLEGAKEKGWVSSEGIVPTLEGDVKAKEGDCICIGVMGEIWPQPASRVKSKYDFVSKEDRDGITFKRYRPKPEQFVEAKQMEKDFVTGDMKGSAGGYKVRSIDDVDDEWVVDQDVFEKTYQKVK